MKKYKIATLGCRTNQYESQAYQDQLEAKGYKAATGEEEADICIINTCTVTQSADKSSRSQVKTLIKKNPKARVIVTGCMVEKDKELMPIEEIKGVNDVVSNFKKETLLNDLFPEEHFAEFSIKNFAAHTRAFVKIQDGCNSFCTYCIIPYVRGRSRSRKVSSIIEEIKTLSKQGYREVVLTGINIGDFDGGDKSATLADLVRLVDNIDGIDRIRISSIDPDEIDDDLLDAVVNSKKTCQSMHVVLQSGSNAILKRMNRKYNRQIFLDTVEKLKRVSPDFTFTTDVIVGFPGETERYFEETLKVLQEVKFAKVHMFPYSRRERTKAATYHDHVPLDVMKVRKQQVLRLSEKYSYELREGFVGKQMPVLLEQSNEKEGVTGHTDNFLKVYGKSNQYQANDLVMMKLIENRPEGLFGEVVGTL